MQEKLGFSLALFPPGSVPGGESLVGWSASMAFMRVIDGQGEVAAQRSFGIEDDFAQEQVTRGLPRLVSEAVAGMVYKSDRLHPEAEKKAVIDEWIASVKTMLSELERLRDAKQ